MSRLRKPDWLAEMQALLTLALVVSAGSVLWWAAWMIFGDGTVIARVSAESAARLTGAAAPSAGSSGLVPGSTVEILVEDPSPGQLVAEAFTGLPAVFVVIALLVMLLRVVRRARREDPFTPGTVKQLRVLAATVIVGGTLAGVVESTAAFVLSSTVADACTTWEFPGHWLLLGFGLLAVAEVIGRGTAMRAELETVI